MNKTYILFLLSFLFFFQSAYAQEDFYWTNRLQGILKYDIENNEIQEVIGIPTVDPQRIALDSISGKLYWADSDLYKILRCNIDGSDLEVVISFEEVAVWAIALDLINGKMYWSDRTNDKIQRANLDGSNIEDIVVSDGAFFRDIELDLLNNKIYWADSSLDVIGRANLDGSEDENFISEGLFNTSTIAIDQENSKIYWSDSAVDSIMRADLNTLIVETLPISGMEEVVDIAIDYKNNKLIWIDLATDLIQRSNLDGSNVETIFEIDGDLNFPDYGGLVLDLANEFIFWTQLTTNKINRVDLDGNNHQVIINTTVAWSNGIAIDKVNGKIYWTNIYGGSIWRSNLDGTNSEILLTEGVVIPGNIALDIEANKMYWTDRRGGPNNVGTIKRANLDGTQMETLIIEGIGGGLSINNPEGIALDLENQKMYFTVQGVGKIWRANLDGTDIERLLFFVQNTGITSEVTLDLTNRYVYWGDNAKGIQRISIDSLTTLPQPNLEVEIIVPEATGCVTGLSLDIANDKMYWVDSIDLHKANLDGTNDEVLFSDLVCGSFSNGYMTSGATHSYVNNESIDCGGTLDGLTELGTFGDSYYYISNDPTNWLSAKAIAESQGGHLVSINTQEENDFLQNNIDEIVFIGWNDRGEEGNFAWDNGDLINVNNFTDSNTEEKDFGKMNFWNGNWGLDNQYVSRRYIVEFPCDSFEEEELLPDLTISSVDPINGNSFEGFFGDILEYSIDIENVSAAPVPNDFFVSIFFSLDSIFDSSDFLHAGFIVNELQGNMTTEEMNFTIPTLPPGDYYFIVFVDDNFQIEESNENNNTKAVPITILPPSDNNCNNTFEEFTFLGEYSNHNYYISNDYLKPEDAKQLAIQKGGSLAAINDQIENDFILSQITQQNISELVYIGLSDHTDEGNLTWMNDDPVDFMNFDFCSFCNTNSEELDYVALHPWNGGWSFSSQFNQRRFIMEVPCEGNTVPLPDLTTINIALSNNLLMAGDQLSYSYLRGNIGDGPAIGGVNFSVYISEDTNFDADDIFKTRINTGFSSPGLSTVNASMTVPELPDGIYYLMIVSDDRQYVYESNENNNVSVAPFEIYSDESECVNSLQGFDYLAEFNGSNYFLSEETAKPTDAQAVAEANGGYLTVINSQAENDFLQSQIDGLFYIGLNDFETEGTLNWVNGEPINFTNFDDCSICNPNSENQDFVMIQGWNGGWSFSNFYNSRKYIVEIPCESNVSNMNMSILNPLSTTSIERGKPMKQLTLEKLHPNPAMDFIFTTINSPIEQRADIQIYNANGGLVNTIPINLIGGKNVTRISIADLPTGIYTVFIPDAQGRNVTIRFVKMKL